MKSKSSNRSFGLLFFIVFLGFSLWPLANGESLQNYLFFISIIFLVLGLLNSKLLTPLKKTWIKFGEILGLVIAPIVMGLVYFVVLTPISLVVKMFGKDLLGLKFLKKQDTYWIIRRKKTSSMKKQF